MEQNIVSKYSKYKPSEQKEGKTTPLGATETKARVWKHFREGICPEGLRDQCPSALLFDAVHCDRSTQEKLPFFTFNVTHLKKKKYVYPTGL